MIDADPDKVGAMRRMVIDAVGIPAELLASKTPTVRITWRDVDPVDDEERDMLTIGYLVEAGVGYFVLASTAPCDPLESLLKVKAPLTIPSDKVRSLECIHVVPTVLTKQRIIGEVDGE